MEYRDWISRERRIRMKILEASRSVNDRNEYRICLQCGEICLCHEARCPNCNFGGISEGFLEDLRSESQHRIRCRYRFRHLER